jgi:hypothetical protein
MAWVAGALALLVLMLISLYRKSIKERRDLTNYALLILLNKSFYAAQRKSLTKLVRTLDAKGATDLGAKVALSMARLSARLGHTMLGTAGLLWVLRITGTTSIPAGSVKVET